MTPVGRVEDDPFWALIGVLEGEVTPESLGRLSVLLQALPADEIRAFQARLEESISSLSEVRLRHEDGSVAVGDGRRALVLSVIAAGPGAVASARSHGDVIIDLLPDFALDFDSVARELYELSDDGWNGTHSLAEASATTSEDADERVMWTYVCTSYPPTPFMEGVVDTLTRWEGSEVYESAVRDSGAACFLCLVAIVDRAVAGQKPGTRSRTRRTKDEIIVDVELDLLELGDGDAAAGEEFVRGLIDTVAKRRGLPTSAEALA